MRLQTGPRSRALSSAPGSTLYSAPVCVRSFSRETLVYRRDVARQVSCPRHVEIHSRTKAATAGKLGRHLPAIIATSESLMRNLFFTICFAVTTAFATAQQYDLVLEGGRVVDPETHLDAVRNVGISNGKIARITADPLTGRRVIHASG